MTKLKLTSLVLASLPATAIAHGAGGVLHSHADLFAVGVGLLVALIAVVAEGRRS